MQGDSFEFIRANKTGVLYEVLERTEYSVNLISVMDGRRLNVPAKNLEKYAEPVEWPSHDEVFDIFTRETDV